MTYRRRPIALLPVLFLGSLALNAVGCACVPPPRPEAWCDWEAYHARLVPLLPSCQEHSDVRQASVARLMPEFPRDTGPNQDAIGYIPLQVVPLDSRQTALLAHILNDPYSYDCINASYCLDEPGFDICFIEDERVHMVTLSASLRFVYVDPAFSDEDFRVVDDSSRLALVAVLADVLEDPCTPQFPLADACP